MFDTAFSDVGDIRSANFFGFSTSCKSLASNIGFKWRIELYRPFWGLEHKEKEMQTFSSTF